MTSVRLAKFCLGLLICVPVLGQSDRGTITGTVLDASGAAVPGTQVTITNTATNVRFATVTTESGTYTAASLPVGAYSVRVQKPGFKPAFRTGIILNAAATVRADVNLEIGSSEQVIEVIAEAPLLSTESAKSSTTVTNKLIEELPLVVGGALRSPFDLAQLTPEAKLFTADNFLIGGGQARGYGITLDGVSAGTSNPFPTSWVTYNTPPLDAITEFTVDTNGYKAEFGHASGGQMTFSSKSGTNRFHGSVFEFLRNDKLDARRFFEARRGVYKQHDFGVSAGGPIFVPKLVDGRNKSFFFVAYEGFRNRVGASTVAASVPTPEMYDGDFSNWVDRNDRLIPIYDPDALTTDASGKLVRLAFPGNKIPQRRFDPLAQKLIDVYSSGPGGRLKPNNGAAPGTSAYVRANHLITQGTELNPWDKFSVKGDHIFSEKDRLSGYFGRNRVYRLPGPNGPARLPGYYSDYNDSRNFSDIYRMSWDHSFTPTILNSFYAGGNNWRENHLHSNEIIGGWKDKFCLPNVPLCENNLSSVSFGSAAGSGLGGGGEFTQWGGTSRSGSENTVYAFNDDVTWIRGRHSFKAGGMYQRNHYNGFGQQGDAGLVAFSFTGTGVPGDTNFTTAGGSAFASFLLGRADSGRTETVRFISQQWPYFAGYFQDDFRVNKRLTLNLGLRWETTLPPVESKDRWSDFSPTRPNPAADNIPGALVFAGTGQGREGSRSLADAYYRAFGPRFGAAYSLTPNTVMRASFARSFGYVVTAAGSSHFLGFVQIFTPVNLSSGVEPTFLYKDGFPPYPLPPFIDPSFGNDNTIPWWQGQEATRLPVNNTWTFSIQRQITPNLVLEAAYNGLAGSRLQTGLLNYNQLHPSVLDRYGRDLLNSRIDSPTAMAAGIRKPYTSFANNLSVAQALRPFPQYRNIDTGTGGGDHSGHSTYHAAVLRVEKRYGAGLNFLGSYVFSKILTDSDSYASYLAAMDHYNRRLEKSIGQFDLTHNFKVGLVYELPFGRGRKYLTEGIGDVLAGGWRVSAIHYYASGAPVALGTTVALPIFAGTNRATVQTYDGWRGATTSGDFDPQTDRFFQPASFFGTQRSDTFGNATRYNPKLRQFPNYNENLSLAKSFNMTEKIRLDFRAEAFNLLNRVRFGMGPVTLQDNNFGRLTSNSDVLNEPRRMQLALKLYW